MSYVLEPLWLNIMDSCFRLVFIETDEKRKKMKLTLQALLAL